MLGWFTADYRDPDGRRPRWAPQDWAMQGREHSRLVRRGELEAWKASRPGVTQREIMVHRYGVKGGLAYLAAWMLAAAAIGLMAWVLFGRLGGRPFPG